MKPIIKSVEELYSRKEGTGEVVLDEMASILRKTRIIAVSDMATLMNVSAHQLNMAVGMITGMTVRSIINGWRLLQAREMLRQTSIAATNDRTAQSSASIDRTKCLDAVARSCGWRNYRVMLKVARRSGFKLV